MSSSECFQCHLWDILAAILQHIYQKLNFTIQKNNDEIKHSQAQMKVDLNEMKDKITGMERKQDQTKVSRDYF
jgi:hypothetical protein